MWVHNKDLSKITNYDYHETKTNENNNHASHRTNAVSQEETAKSEPEKDTFNQALEVIKESPTLKEDAITGKREMGNQTYKENIENTKKKILQEIQEKNKIHHKNEEIRDVTRDDNIPCLKTKV